jgi:hypothetical protein
MGRTGHILRTMIIGMTTAGAIVIGMAGTAGATAPVPAATPAASTGATQPQTHSGSDRAAHFNCARAPRALARIDRIEARISAGLPKLNQAEARAKAAGNTQRAARIQKRIDRLDSPALKSRLDRLTARIDAKCGAPAPTTGHTTTTTAPAT